MGISTDGILCFGIMLEEEIELPWGKDDIEDWWIYEVKGYKNLYEVYDDKGEYINGVKPAEEVIDKYFEARRKFKEKNPLPISLVLHCSCDYPLYIVSLPHLNFYAERGYPEKIDPEKLNVKTRDVDLIVNFCKEHNLETVGEPNWYLCSLWC